MTTSTMPSVIQNTVTKTDQWLTEGPALGSMAKSPRHVKSLLRVKSMRVVSIPVAKDLALLSLVFELGSQTNRRRQKNGRFIF